MKYPYAKRMSHLAASEIRELLKLTEKPEIISFAGGLPAPELFPVEHMPEASRRVLTEDGMAALQYSATEGYEPLRRWVAERLNSRRGTDFDAENILLTHGSQQALDLTGKVFLDEGDVILCESPTYLSAIGAFRAYGCKFHEVLTDDSGMLPDDLERCLREIHRIKLIYVIPDFQNPTGRTWSTERRRFLADAARRYNVMVIEDDPYGELRFEGAHRPSVKSFDTAGCVFYLGTFSKILCPGYRIGWVAGSKEAISKYVIVKQGTDLQSSTIAQREIMKYLELYDIDAHIGRIRAAYKSRRDVTVKTLAAVFPAGTVFTRPEGGLFSWVELPPAIHSRTLLERCLAQNVAFVPGSSFFPNGGHENTLRLNFSNMPEAKIEEGLNRIGKLLKVS